MARKLRKRNFIPILGARNSWKSEDLLQLPIQQEEEETTPSATFEPLEQVVSQQTENFDSDGKSKRINLAGGETLYFPVTEILYPVVIACVGLVLLLIALIGILAWSKRRNKNDEEKPQASSILIYPYQQGTPPQFL